MQYTIRRNNLIIYIFSYLQCQRHRRISRVLLGSTGVVDVQRGQMPTVARNNFAGAPAAGRRGRVPRVARNTFAGGPAASRIGPSSAGSHAAAPRSSVTAVDLACTS